jgi:hypothetical protein
MESKIIQGVSSPPVVQRIKESNIPSPLSATQQALSATQRAIQRIRTFKEKKVNLVRNEREEEELKQQNALNSALRKALHLSSLQHQSPSTRKQHSDVVVDDSEQQYDGDEAADSRFPDGNRNTLSPLQRCRK